MAKKRQPINTAKLPKKRGRPRKAPAPQAPATLTAKERRFVEEFCVDFNATQAAIRAGYSKKSAANIGYEVRRKPEIAAAIDAYLASHAVYTAKTKEDIEREIEKLGFWNIADYHRIVEGEPVIDLSDCTRAQLAAVVELETHDYTDGRGDDARDVKKVRIKFSDKRAALMDLAKLRGLVVDRGEMKVEDVSREEIRQETARLPTAVLEKMREHYDAIDQLRKEALGE